MIVKTLRQINLLREDLVAGELNIIFDNCSGQNKNNMVLKLAAYFKATGYYKTVNFIFLINGHTKNAAGHLFNSLKSEYHKQDIFTMEVLVKKLNTFKSVTAHPSAREDFLDYDTLFKIFSDLAGKINKNHIFLCGDDGSRLILWQSNLDNHKGIIHRARKKLCGDLFGNCLGSS